MAGRNSKTRRAKKCSGKKHEDKENLALRIGGRLATIAEAKKPIDFKSVWSKEVLLNEAIAALRNGTAGRDEVTHLAEAISVCTVCIGANLFDCGQYDPLARAATDALEAIGNRFVLEGRWYGTDEELKTLAEVVELRIAIYSHEENTQGLETAACNQVLAEIQKGNVVRWANPMQQAEAA